MDNDLSSPGEHPVPVHGVSPEPPDSPETTGPMAIIQAALLALRTTFDMNDLEPHEIEEIMAPGFLEHVSQQADGSKVLCVVPLEGGQLIAMRYGFHLAFWDCGRIHSNRIIISAVARLSGEPESTMISRIYGEYITIPPGGWHGDWPETSCQEALRALMRHCLKTLEQHIPSLPDNTASVKGVCFP